MGLIGVGPVFTNFKLISNIQIQAEAYEVLSMLRT